MLSSAHQTTPVGLKTFCTAVESYLKALVLTYIWWTTRELWRPSSNSHMRFAMGIKTNQNFQNRNFDSFAPFLDLRVSLPHPIGVYLEI
jgi:hypothetical protein